jgi:hypothetical protein
MDERKQTPLAWSLSGKFKRFHYSDMPQNIPIHDLDWWLRGIIIALAYRKQSPRLTEGK